MAFQTCSGGLMRCSFGTAPSSLVATPKAIVSAARPAANIMDHQPMLNIPPFGLCSCPANPTVAAATAAATGVLTPMPCVPNTPAPWVVGIPGVLVAGFPALDDESTLMCVYGGAIRFTSAGQRTHEVGRQASTGGLVGTRVIASSTAGSAASAAKAPTHGAKTAFRGALGDDVDRLAAQSPSLVRDLKALQFEGWEIRYGPAGRGSYVRRDRSTITLDGNLRNDPKAATRTLAHEVGHATYSTHDDVSSKEKFVASKLADEGAATINNIKVQREIMATSKTDIGIAGKAANHTSYNQAFDKFLKDGDADSARKAIGEKFGSSEITSTTHQPYREYYGSWYDKNFPTKR